jgi:hypothetical protein
MPAVRIVDTGDLKAVIRQLRRQADGKELAKELRTGLREVLVPVRDEVKAAYRASPSRGRRGRPGPSLRSLLARVTRVEVRTSGKLAGARLRVDGRKMPAGMRSLPQMWEGEKRWRWPVYGDRTNWVQGRARPTFDRTVEPHEDEAQRAVEAVLGRVVRKLEAGR